MCPVAHFPLATRVICSRGALYVGCMHFSIVAEPTTMHMLVGGAGPWLVGCQAPPHSVAADPLVGGPVSWHGW